MPEVLAGTLLYAVAPADVKGSPKVREFWRSADHLMGFLYLTVESHEIPWNPMEPHGILWNPIVVIDVSDIIDVFHQEKSA